ncbi:hypothetical protein CR513_30063, partial [Mucuna pruriens]
MSALLSLRKHAEVMPLYITLNILNTNDHLAKFDSKILHRLNSRTLVVKNPFI